MADRPDADRHREARMAAIVAKAEWAAEAGIAFGSRSGRYCGHGGAGAKVMLPVGSVRLWAVVGLAALAVVVFSGSAARSAQTVKGACPPYGGVSAVIEGQPTCLSFGRRCKHRLDAEYRRYGFACPRWGLTIVSRWRIRDLGALSGFPNSWATGINEHGEVIGVSSATKRDQADERVFLWRNGRMRDITPVAWPARVTLTAINDAGQVLEDLTSATGEEHAFEWEDGVSTELGTLGGTNTHATAINASGQIVGWSDIAPGVYPEYHAFLWEEGVMRDLGTFGGQRSTASSINARGQIVGGAANATGSELNDFHAFLWDDGEMRDLGTLGFSNGANAINDQGLIVGTSREGFGMTSYARALYWKDGAISDFGPDFKFDSHPTLLNNRGQVVLSKPGPDGTYHSVLWKDGSYRNLDCWSEASALNDRGQILCTQRDRPVSPQSQAVILEKGRAWNLSNLGARGTAATALNERDQIVGTATTHHLLHAVIWTRR